MKINIDNIPVLKTVQNLTWLKTKVLDDEKNRFFERNEVFLHPDVPLLGKVMNFGTDNFI